jgi:hypothetical protein
MNSWLRTHTTAGLELANFQELCRFRKAGKTRIYGVRVASGGDASLWVIAENEARTRTQRKLFTLESAEPHDRLLDDLHKQLRRGGWCPV